jgi:hypothetical protein
MSRYPIATFYTFVLGTLLQMHLFCIYRSIYHSISLSITLSIYIYIDISIYTVQRQEESVNSSRYKTHANVWHDACLFLYIGQKVIVTLEFSFMLHFDASETCDTLASKDMYLSRSCFHTCLIYRYIYIYIYRYRYIYISIYLCQYG